MHRITLVLLMVGLACLFRAGTAPAQFSTAGAGCGITCSGGGASLFTPVQVNRVGTVFSGTTIVLAFASNVTAGNAILVCTFESSSTLGTLTVTDNHSDSFTTGGSTATHGSNQMQSAYAPNAVGGATTVTATFSAAISGGQGQMWIEEWSGINAVSPGDGGNALYTSGSNTPGQAFNSGSFTPTTNNDMIWGCGHPGSGGATAGAGFTAATVDNTNSTTTVYKTLPTAGSTNAAFLTGTGSFDLYALGAAFKH